MLTNESGIGCLIPHAPPPHHPVVLLQRLLLLVEVVPRLLARLLALLLLLLLWPRFLSGLLLLQRQLLVLAVDVLLGVGVLLLLLPLSGLLLLQRQLLVLAMDKLVGVGVLLRWLLWLRVMVLVGVAAARLACGVSCTAESCTFPSGSQGGMIEHCIPHCMGLHSPMQCGSGQRFGEAWCTLLMHLLWFVSMSGLVACRNLLEDLQV